MGKITVYVLLACIVVMVSFFVAMEMARGNVSKEADICKDTLYSAIDTANSKAEARFVHIAGGGVC